MKTSYLGISSSADDDSTASALGPHSHTNVLNGGIGDRGRQQRITIVASVTRAPVTASAAAAAAAVTIVTATVVTAVVAVVHHAYLTGPDQPQQTLVVHAGHTAVGPHAIVFVLPPPVVVVVVITVTVVVDVTDLNAPLALVTPSPHGHHPFAGQPVLHRVHDHVRVHRTTVAEMFQQYARDERGHGFHVQAVVVPVVVVVVVVYRLDQAVVVSLSSPLQRTRSTCDRRPRLSD